MVSNDSLPFKNIDDLMQAMNTLVIKHEEMLSEEEFNQVMIDWINFELKINHMSAVQFADYLNSSLAVIRRLIKMKGHNLSAYELYKCIYLFRQIPDVYIEAASLNDGNNSEDERTSLTAGINVVSSQLSNENLKEYFKLGESLLAIQNRVNALNINDDETPS